MTDREKIAHLLRRFGLGAGTAALAEYEPLGVEGALKKLLYYEDQDSQFTIQPYQLQFDPLKPEADVNLDSLFASFWWTMQMSLTARPFEEKLALFWHTNLAAGADKVEFGPLMVEYLRTLRQYGPHDFATLLKKVSQCGAMLKYLDEDESLAGRPNENFAREVMELFTMGVGNYTEQDVHESARVFTGFGIRYPVYEGDGKFYQERARNSILKNIPMVGGYWSEDLHDKSNKTILGETAPYTPEQFLDRLAHRPETAKRIGTRMFEFFAYRHPSEAIIGKMANIFTKSGENVRKTLWELAHLDEFWSPQCVLQQVKSPVDFTISVYRQLGLMPTMRKMQGPYSNIAPINQDLRNGGYYLMDKLTKQGLQPLYPPSVKGWDWGSSWITASALIERMKVGQEIFYAGKKGQQVGYFIAQQIMSNKPTNSEEAVRLFLEIFDGEHLENLMPVLVKGLDDAGGIGNFAKPESAPWPISSLAKLVFASNEYQFC